MKFWKEHPALRVVVMAILVVGGLALTIIGWKMTGQNTGLIIILAGLICLLIALAIYNKPFQDPKNKP